MKRPHRQKISEPKTFGKRFPGVKKTSPEMMQHLENTLKQWLRFGGKPTKERWDTPIRLNHGYRRLGAMKLNPHNNGLWVATTHGSPIGKLSTHGIKYYQMLTCPVWRVHVLGGLKCGEHFATNSSSLIFYPHILIIPNHDSVSSEGPLMNHPSPNWLSHLVGMLNVQTHPSDFTWSDHQRTLPILEPIAIIKYMAMDPLDLSGFTDSDPRFFPMLLDACPSIP